VARGRWKVVVDGNERVQQGASDKFDGTIIKFQKTSTTFNGTKEFDVAMNLGLSPATLRVG